MTSNHLILWPPLLLLPSNFPSIRVLSNESVLHIRWPKYWSFSLSISPSDEYSELISFRMEWLDLIQGTLKSLLQHHSSKHQFFGAQSSSQTLLLISRHSGSCFKIRASISTLNKRHTGSWPRLPNTVPYKDEYFKQMRLECLCTCSPSFPNFLGVHSF